MELHIDKVDILSGVASHVACQVFSLSRFFSIVPIISLSSETLISVPVWSFLLLVLLWVEDV